MLFSMYYGQLLNARNWSLGQWPFLKLFIQVIRLLHKRIYFKLAPSIPYIHYMEHILLFSKDKLINLFHFNYVNIGRIFYFYCLFCYACDGLMSNFRRRGRFVYGESYEGWIGGVEDAWVREEVLIVRVSECQPFPRDRRWICTGSACMICTVLYLWLC